ncbi:centromere protein K isoform X2 [Corvus hawaiiensis]|uniref:centromere protein K isoform X2 n=1 Tax=Corvus hawaiiensis TaxID=134902 RepID=UPI00201A0C00|nr:centromere protein K isoform X2 [Corvus hawaiiensis]
MAVCLPEIANAGGPVNYKEELVEECESIWKQMEECQSKLTLLGTDTLLQSDAKLSLLMLRWKTLTVDYLWWQSRNPEVISTNPDVLLELGKEELQKIKSDLEMVLLTVQLKNKKLEEDLEREQQWCEEQEQVLDTLNKAEEEKNTQVEQSSTESLKVRGFDELKNKIMTLKTYKKELLSALGEFLDEHFPCPETGENTKNKNSSAEPAVKLITMQEILEILINKLMTTPHEPYVTINESFWPPYIELLLRYGIVLRHPEDPKRLRLEAFHK